MEKKSTAIKRVTIREVAKEAGVSITLVSFVMNAKRREDGSLDCPVNKVTATFIGAPHIITKRPTI